ncbi:MAG: serine hydrolase [Anaerolineae bacterium]|nr:serine hydrolase [Anaerolineae bacterium]
MDYGRLGERQRLTLPWLEIVSALLLLAAILVTMMELISYSNTQDSLQTDLTVAGIQVGGLEPDGARARWEAVYLTQPVELIFEGHTILLHPEEIGFRTYSENMLAAARAHNSREKDFWAGFWNYLWRRPVAAASVPLEADFPESELRRYLDDLAQRYDTMSGEAGFDLNTLTFSTGAAGKRLDIDAAMVEISRALFEPEPENRRIYLNSIETSAAGRNMGTLHQAVLDLMSSRGFVYNGDQTLASVYIMDLATGEEVAILADVAHSAVSTIKIPIMINMFRANLLVAPDTAYLLTESILCSNNSASNLLMQIVGDGTDVESMLRDGLSQVSCTAQALGADHTYISAPLYVADRAYEFEASVCRPRTAANTTYSTNPDPYSQTTAEDMGMLLSEIYDCANHGSGLQALYPEDITQTECQQMLEVLSGNHIDRLLELGLPEGTRISHKNGWGPETSGDAGIVFSPGGDYIVVVYTWERDLDGNNLPTLASWELIEEISRLTYNYFNADAPLYERREPINVFGAIDCVTVMSPELVNLNDIDANRVDANGDPLPDACYGGAIHFNADTGTCKAWDNWGQ